MNDQFDVRADGNGERRSLAALLREVANDSAVLLRQEIALAKAEIRQNIKDIAKHVSQLAVGGGFALLGLFVFVAFLIIGLGVLLGGSYWLSALIVAVLLLATGGTLGFLGIKHITTSRLAPEQTIGTLRETSAWASSEVAALKAGLKGEPTTTYRASAVAPSAQSTPALESAKTGEKAPTSKGGADSPEERQPPLSMPLWKRVMSEIKTDDVTGQGAKLAYFMFTSLPPALLVLFGVTGFVGGGTAEFVSGQLTGAVPGSPDDPSSAAGFINQFVEQVVSEKAPGPLSVGILTGIWAASAVFVGLMDSLNVAFDETETRGWFKKRGLAVLVMIGFLALFVVGSVVLIAGPSISDALGLGAVGNLVWNIVHWPAAFLLVVCAFFLVYYVLPNRDQSKCKKVLFKASAIAAGIFLVFTLAFRIYISNFGSYSETYGFVGAILVLLLWMYLTGIVMLIGGEVASEMERSS